MSKAKSKSDNKTEKALAAEKEQFGKQQLQSISKTITSSETPPKEKYVRNIILGTHKECGATTFWSYILNLPLSSNSMICWKVCYMLHKVLRDGHPNGVRDSHRYCRNVKDMGLLWGNLHDRYGHIVALFAKFLCLKMEFHVKHKTIPGNLETSDDTVEREAGSDMNKVLDMTQELLDSMDAGLKMSETVLRQLDANGAKSNTPAGQCRLTPLIPLILDLSHLYHFSVKLMFKLHSRITPDALLGHRERFRDLFNSLKQFFDRAREMEFFKTVIQIPDLPDSPPNFLRAAALAEYQKPVAFMPNESREDEEAEAQPDREVMPQYYMVSQMGAPDWGMDQREPETESLRKQLDVLKPELQLIKTEAQRCVIELKSQVNRLEGEVEEQRTHKQMALVDNENLKMEVEALRCATIANAGAQVGYKEADTRAQASEVRFSQLKERHAELISSHADLMNKNTETMKFLASTKREQEELLRAKQQLAGELELLKQETRNKAERQQNEVDRLHKELLDQQAELAHMHGILGNKEKEGNLMGSALAELRAERDALLRSTGEREAEVSMLRQQAQQHQTSLDMERDRSNRELEALRAQLQQQLAINAEQKLEIDRLRRELDQARAEVSRVNSALQNKEMTGSQLSGSLAGLAAERDALLRSTREQEAELAYLRQQAQHSQGLLDMERQRASMELGSLQAQLQQQASREGELAHKLQEEQFCLLQCAVVEAEGIILDAVAKLDDPVHVRCVSSPDYLINRAEVTLGSIDKMQQSHLVYLGNRSDASGMLRTVTQFSHLAADTIVNGAATSHSAPTDQADRLTDSCRDCATHCLQYLKELKLQATLQRADPAAIRYVVQRILTIGQELRPNTQDVLKEELGEVVDKEMLATSMAIEEAVLRMDEILNQARRDTSGIKLEVNQSILGSCSDLMKAIHMLVTAATDLQKDIVEGGRGGASVDEFYAKNSRWTEGLISASKAVGWGATQMLESADRVAVESGKYEELIACSHEIAGSTAQLVAASKVKADRNNKKLSTLQQASRHVNDMAALVVTSTKHGQQQITERAPMDFSGLSLIKLKKEEMEAQVKVLELESQLEQERVRLGELRKRHYDMGSSDTEAGPVGVDDADSFPPPPPPTLLDPGLEYQASSQTQLDLDTKILTNTNPFLQPKTQSYTSSMAYTPDTTPATTYTPSTTHTPPTTHTPSTTYTPPTTYTPAMSYTPSPSYTPPTSYSTPSMSYTPPTSYTTPSQAYTPPISYTTPSQAYMPPTSYTIPSQAYTPPISYTTPSQAYTPPISYTTPSQAYVPSQPYTPKPSPNVVQPQTLSQSQPCTFTSNLPQSTAAASQSNAEPSKPAPTKKSNIFSKSGNLLKNAFKRNETGTGET